MLFEASLLQSLPDSIFGYCIERINILFDGAFEKEGRLRDNREMAPERVKTHSQSIKVVYLINRPLFRLHDPEKNLNER